MSGAIITGKNRCNVEYSGRFQGMSSEPAAQAATVAGAAGETIAAQGADAMIFGFNTDVPGKDAVYHVQTEDRGAKNPVIESMIYVGGKILGRRRTPYVPSELSREKIE